MTQPLVSVVIPIYHVEQYLQRCIQSVADQTYRNLEIILVDDGSPDNCPAICDAWAEKDGRVRVIHKENAGLGMARNSGLDVASGTYICFFDSDDYVDITIIEKCVAAAEQNDADAVVFGRWDVFEDGRTVRKPISSDKRVFRGQEVREELLPGMFTYDRGFGVSAWGKLYRRETLSKNGIRFPSEREIVSEDAYFALEFYAKANTVTVIPENLYYYRKRETSLSRQYRPDRQRKNDDFLEKSLVCIRKNHLPQTVAVSLMVRYHFYTVAALKQIMASNETEAEKKKAVGAVFTSPTLRGTLSPEVLGREGKKSLQIFFLLLKCRCYRLCGLLLKYRMRTP